MRKGPARRASGATVSSAPRPGHPARQGAPPTPARRAATANRLAGVRPAGPARRPADLTSQSAEPRQGLRRTMGYGSCHATTDKLPGRTRQRKGWPGGRRPRWSSACTSGSTCRTYRHARVTHSDPQWYSAAGGPDGENRSTHVKPGLAARRCSSARPPARICSVGAARPVISSTCRAAWCTSSSNPLITIAPDRPAASARLVGHG
jgi:hypothetical protein